MQSRRLRHLVPAPLRAQLRATQRRAERALSKETLVAATSLDGGLTRMTCTDGTILTTSPERDWCYAKGYEHRLRWLLDRYSKPPHVRLLPGDVALDVGANVGEWSIGAARIGAFVVAIEGDLSTFECLRVNTRVHPGVVAINEVVGDEVRESSFYVGASTADSSLIRSPATPDERAVQLTTLDTLCERLSITPTFVKMDAEGAEPEVLAGAQRVLEGLRAVAIDCGPERGGQRTASDVANILQLAGMRTVQVATRGKRKDIVFGYRAPPV